MDITDLQVMYALAAICFIVAVAGATVSFLKRKSNSDSEFNSFFTVFVGLVFTFFFLSAPFFDSGGYGLFESTFNQLSDIKQIALVLIFVASFFITFLTLYVAPLLLCDEDLNLKFVSHKKVLGE